MVISFKVLRGVTCLTFVFSHHLVARVYESKAEFRSALQHEKEGYTIYKNQVRRLGLLEAGLRPTGCSGAVSYNRMTFLRWVRRTIKPRRAPST